MSQQAILLYQKNDGKRIAIHTSSFIYITRAKSHGAIFVCWVQGHNLTVFTHGGGYLENMNGQEFMRFLKENENEVRVQQLGESLIHYAWPDSQNCMTCKHGRFINGEGFDYSDYVCDIQCRENDGFNCPKFEEG